MATPPPHATKLQADSDASRNRMDTKAELESPSGSSSPFSSDVAHFPPGDYETIGYLKIPSTYPEHFEFTARVYKTSEGWSGYFPDIPIANGTGGSDWQDWKEVTAELKALMLDIVGVLVYQGMDPPVPICKEVEDRQGVTGIPLTPQLTQESERWCTLKAYWGTGKGASVFVFFPEQVAIH